MTAAVFPTNLAAKIDRVQPVSVSYLHRKRQFASGYFHIAKEGLNNKQEDLEIEWKALTEQERRDLEQFLDLAGIGGFVYTPPGALNPGVWYASSVSYVTTAGDYFNVRVQLTKFPYL